jgi:acyl carrier protein
VIAQRKNQTTEAQIIEVMSWMLNIPASQLRPYTHLRDDLFLDNFDISMLIAKLESRFGVFLTPEEVETIETVRDAASYFSSKHAA